MSAPMDLDDHPTKKSDFLIQNEGDYVSLIKIAENTKNPEHIRLSAGTEAVKILSKRRMHTQLRRLAREDFMPLPLRVEAGIQSIKICIEKGPYKKLIVMAEDERIPKEVREAAKNSLEAAGMKAVEKCILENRYLELLHNDLQDISTEERLPESVRRAAADALDAKKIELIKTYASKGWFHRLLEISKDSRFSEEVRKRAGVWAIRECIRRGNYAQMLSVADNQNYLSEIRDEARKSIKPAAMRALEICIRKERHHDPVRTDLENISSDERLPNSVRDLASRELSKITGFPSTDQTKFPSPHNTTPSKKVPTRAFRST